MLRLKVTPVVGLPQFTGWSQVAESAVSVSVRLIVVYAISGKHAGNVGRDISEKVSDYYFYDVEQLHDFLQQLVSYAHANECKMYFACAVLGKSKSVFATYGGSIFLKRGEKSGRILTSESEVKLVEGNYTPGDVFVLTTLQADQFLSEIQLKFQQGYDVDIIITSIVPGLHSQEDSSLSALVFINKDEEEEAPFFEFEEDNQPTNSDSKERELQNELIQSDETVKHAQAGLAEVSLEVDQILAPSFVGKFFQFGKIFFSVFKNKMLVFLASFFRFIKRVVLKTWLLLKRINIRKVKNGIVQLRTQGIKSFLRKQTVYVIESRSNKGIWKLILIGIVAIIIFGFFAIQKYRSNVELKRVQLLLTPIQAMVVAAKEQAVSDPIAARGVITYAIEQVSTLEAENAKSSAQKLFTAEKQALLSYLESISGREELQELEVFYDLRLAQSNFIGTGIDIVGSVVTLYDKEMKQVLLLNTDSKQVAMRNFSDIASVSSAVIQDEYVFVLLDGVYKYKVGFDAQTELEVVREAGDSNKNATLLDAYDRYVYVVNPEKRNIFRYAQTEDGYSEPVGWMKSATGIKYEELRSLSVDGDVWLTTSDGQLKKFTSGREETLTLRGLDVPFTSDIYAFTNEKQEKLYVLDPSNNRVVILEKNGDFVKEIKSVSLGAASGIAVSEDLGKIFVVSGSIVYQINL